MTVPSMTFVLSGRDQLSRVLDRAGDASDRLARRLLAASINGDAAMRRFTSNTTRNLADMQRDTDAGGKALEELGKVTKLLAPAAIPAAASLVPLAASAGTVAVATAAMTAALIPQIGAVGEASEAQKKYDDAVAQSGAHSEAAATALADYQRTLAQLPPETRKAAVAVGILKDNYQQWSDSLAKDTMAPFTKGVAIVNTLLPKTTGLVKAASGEADRFMTILGGQINSPGLDALNSKFTSFAQRTLRRVNDEIVHLLRVGEGQNVGGPAREFMDWARAQGPTVANVLRSVATALVNILNGASGVGVSLLQTVQVLARLVSAVPPSAIAVFLQLAIALKLTKAAALGLVAARSALAGFGVQLVAMNAAAAAAPGRLAAVRAAILALSRTTKIAMAGTGIGLAILAITELTERTKHAPPDVDKLTDSLRRLGAGSAVSGEAAKAFGKDLGSLYDKVRSLTDPSTTDKVQQFLVGWTGWDSTPVKDAKADIDSIDKALANLVQSGESDLAATALRRLTAEYGKGGRDTQQFTSKLNDYKSALADAKFEQQLAADSMGLFGSQAQAVQAKLDAQKRSADGLRQSIQALNDVHRSAYDAETKFEGAIDSLAKSLEDNGKTLSANTEKGRANRDAISALGAATDDLAAKKYEETGSWSASLKVYDRGRAKLIKAAEAAGYTRSEAKKLADQLLKIPNRTTLLKGDVSDLDAKIDRAQRKVNSLRQKRKTAVGAEKSQLDREIAAAQARVDSLRQRREVALRAVDRASATARAIQRAIDAVRSKTVTITTVRHTLGVEGTAGRQNAKLNGYAGGGNPQRGEVAWVGEHGPELMSFDGTERIFDHAKSMTMISPSREAGGLAGAGLISGMVGATSGVGAAARAMAAAITAGIREELQIASPSKKTAALAKDTGKGLIVGLTGSRDRIKATAKDLANDIKTAFSGKKEAGLLKYVDQQTDKLLAAAKKRDAVAARIAEAKSFAKDVTKNARASAGLSNLGMEPEQVTAGGIKAGLASKLAQVKRFTTYINILAKKGLNKSLLKQILNMGPEDGYAYASALVGADKATFQQINSLQKQLNDSTTRLGRAGADRLYDSGKNASKGFLAGLSAEEKQLERTMERLAKKMQAALRKALGIRSPARKLIPDGINSARGVAVGVLEGLPYVDRAMQAVAGRMAGRPAIAPVAGRAAVSRSATGAAAPIVINVSGAIDPYTTARQIQRILLDYKRGHGGASLGFD